ncbi:MAG: nitroreductase family protein [Halodesulfovibrio sp.]
MLDFKIDADTCTRCGECARDCFAGIIEMDDVPVIRPENEKKCIECQHCLAVCKPGALSIFGVQPAASKLLKGNLPEPEKMETLIMGRRSTRHYKKEGVDPKLIDHLLTVASHAPTAVNLRVTTFTVVDDTETMNRLRKEMTEAALAALHENRIPTGYERIGNYIQGCENGTDVIFRTAPHLLIASAPEKSLAPMADCHIAMSYFELLANSHGIGTVWNGIARALITAVLPEFKSRLGIPDDHLIACVMSFGLPAMRYHRTVQRPGATISQIKF